MIVVKLFSLETLFTLLASPVRILATVFGVNVFESFANSALWAEEGQDLPVGVALNSWFAICCQSGLSSDLFVIAFQSS